MSTCILKAMYVEKLKHLIILNGGTFYHFFSFVLDTIYYELLVVLTIFGAVLTL